MLIIFNFLSLRAELACTSEVLVSTDHCSITKTQDLK